MAAMVAATATSVMCDIPAIPDDHADEETQGESKEKELKGFEEKDQPLG